MDRAGLKRFVPAAVKNLNMDRLLHVPTVNKREMDNRQLWRKPCTTYICREEGVINLGRGKDAWHLLYTNVGNVCSYYY